MKETIQKSSKSNTKSYMDEFASEQLSSALENTHNQHESKIII